MQTWMVVLAGGVGSRFWPLSTGTRPKQLLPLLTDAPLLRDTLTRIGSVAPVERVLVLTNAALAGPVRETAGTLPEENVVVEPAPAGTAAALAWAAREIQRRGGADNVMVSVHADWAIGDPERFVQSLRQAARTAAESGALVTVGVVPQRDDPGFGYVVPGAEHPSWPGARQVLRFVEKPTTERAAELRGQGALWNSGIFAWRVGVFLDELRRHTPEVAAALETTGREEFFAAVQPVSVDVGLLERSDNVLVMTGDFGWDDIGTWGALLRARAPDPQGNVTHGAVFTLNSARNVAHSDGPTLVLFGVNDLVVIASGEVVLVTTPERSADLKTLLHQLPADLGGGQQP